MVIALNPLYLAFSNCTGLCILCSLYYKLHEGQPLLFLIFLNFSIPHLHCICHQQQMDLWMNGKVNAWNKVTPLNVENLCEQMSTCKAKEVTTTHRGTENTTTEEEICLSQREQTVHCYIFSCRHKRLTFRFQTPRLQNCAQKRNKRYCSTCYLRSVIRFL